MQNQSISPKEANDVYSDHFIGALYVNIGTYEIFSLGGEFPESLKNLQNLQLSLGDLGVS